MVRRNSNKSVSHLFDIASSLLATIKYYNIIYNGSKVVTTSQETMILLLWTTLSKYTDTLVVLIFPSGTRSTYVHVSVSPPLSHYLSRTHSTLFV